MKNLIINKNKNLSIMKNLFMKPSKLFITLILLMFSCMEKHDIEQNLTLETCNTSKFPTSIEGFYKYYDFNCKRYFLSKEKLPWIESKNNAAKLGGTLAYVSSQEENDFIIKMISTEQSNLEIVWLGLYNKYNENNLNLTNKNTFKYVDIKGNDLTWSNWMPGEPNNTNYVENVVEMYPKNLGRWNDYRSQYERNYVIVFE